MSKQYIISKEMPEVIEILQNRDVIKNNITRQAVLGKERDDESLKLFLNKDLTYKIEDKAVIEFLGRLKLGISPDFIKDAFSLNNENIIWINSIIKSYYDERYKTGNKNSLLYARAVKDIFTPNQHEIRHVCTGRYTPLQDATLPNIIEENFDSYLRFHEASINKYTTKFRYFSDDSVEIEGRDILFGYGIINSEFGYNSFGVAIFECDTECSNQFITRKERFGTRIPHKATDPETYALKFKDNIKALNDNVDIYKKLLQESNKTPLKIKKIDDIIEDPPNSNVRILPEYIKHRIIDVFEEDNLGLTNFGLRSAMTRIIKDERELEDHILLIKAIDSLI